MQTENNFIREFGEQILLKSFKFILNTPSNSKKKQIRVSSHSSRCTTDWYFNVQLRNIIAYSNLLNLLRKCEDENLVTSWSEVITINLKDRSIKPEVNSVADWL